MAKRGNGFELGIEFPRGGLARQFAFQAQRPYTTPEAINVWPDNAGDTILTEQRGRDRGGSRPGIRASHNGGPWPTGAAAPVRLLTTLRPVVNDDLRQFFDGFVGDELSSKWTAASWLGTPSKPGVWPDDYLDDDNPVTYEDPRAAVLEAIEDLNAERPYTIELQLQAQDDKFHGAYQIFALMDDTTPDVTQDGIIVELVMTDELGTFEGSLSHYAGGSLVGGAAIAFDTTESPINDVEDGLLEVLIDARDDFAEVRVKVYWKDHLLLDQELDVSTPIAGSRMGFGLDPSNTGGVCFADWFAVKYHVDNSGALTNSLIVMMSAGGELFAETTDLTSFDVVESECNLSSDRMLMAAEFSGKLYIADYGPIKAQGTDGTINLTGTELRNDGSFAWTDRDIDPKNDVVVITNGLGNVTNGNYKIVSVSAESILLDRDTGVTDASGTCHYRIERAPKIFDPGTGKLEIWETDQYTAEEDPDENYKGAVPIGCSTIALYRGRIAMAGASHNPRLWFLSRQNDLKDFDYSQLDEGTAAAGDVSTAGVPGEGITALIPHTDDYLIVGTRSTTWKFVGDPASGGQLVNLSQTVGIMTKKAWCYDTAGGIFFLGYAGIFRVGPGAGSYPEYISAQLPKTWAVADDDRDSYEAMLEYDVVAKAVHIYFCKTDGDVTSFNVQSMTYADGWATVTLQGSPSLPHGLRSQRRVVVAGWDQAAYNGNHEIIVTGSYSFKFRVEGTAPATPATGGGTIKIAGTHFWFDTEGRGFWQMVLPLDWEPTAITAVNGRHGTDSAVLLGVRAGYIGAYRDTFESDGTGATLDSYVIMGPFGIARMSSLVTVLSAVLAADCSLPVTWKLYSGDSAEEAFDSQPAATGTFTRAGQNYMYRPRTRGKFFWIKLQGPGANPWAMEEVQLQIHEAGSHRLL